MNHIYIGLSLSLFCVFVAYFLLPTVFLLTVISLILVGSYLKDDFPLFRYVATHVSWFYHRICEICCSIKNMYSQSDISNVSFQKRSENNGSVSNNLAKVPLSYNSSGVHNLSSQYLLKTSPMSTSRPSWNTSNNVNLRHVYPNNSPQPSIQDYPSTSRNVFKDESIAPSRQYTNLSPFLGVSSQTPRKDVSASSPGNNYPSENTSRTSNKSAQALDARLYANVNSPGFCSRVAEHLTATMTHQPKYDTVGAFPVVHLKNHPSKIKIKTPVRVRLAPPSNDLSYSSGGMNSMTRSPLSGADESMKSVLQVLKEISRKRIHSHVDEDSEDSSKRLRISDVQYNSDGVLHATLLQQTIQGKRAREETSPNEDDVKKRRKPLRNNEITSSLSSSLSIKPPHLKTTKRKAPDIDDSVSTTPTLGKQLKIQTEITPPLSRAQFLASNSLTGQECEVQNALVHSPRRVSVDDGEKTPIVTEEWPMAKVASPVATSLSDTDDDKVVSRLLGRMSTPVDETALLEIPVKKNVFMSTNDLSLSPPKENRLAAMIAVLGGPSADENLEGASTHSEIKRSERNLPVKVLFTSPATPNTPKQHKKVTFSDTLTETKIYDRDTCASPLGSGTSVESLNKEQITNNFKPLSLNFGLSAFSPGATESVKQMLDSSSPALSEAPAPPTVSTLVSQTPSFSQQTTTIVTSTNNSEPMLSFFTSTSRPENTKLPGLGFGAVSPPVQINQESTSTQLSTTNSVSAKPFSFGNESKTTAPAEYTGFGSPSIFANKAIENGTTKSVVTPVLTKTADQRKHGSHFFPNENAITNGAKSDGVKSNQLVNGFTPTSAAKTIPPFTFNPSPSKTPSSNSLFPSLSTSSIQSTPAFNFGLSSSVAPALSTTIPKTVVSSNTVTSQPMPNLFTSLANQPSQSNNAFNSATNNLLQSSPFSKGTNATSQASSMLKTGSGQTSNVFDVNPVSDLTSGVSQVPSVFGSNTFGASVKGSIAPQNNAPTQTSNMFASGSVSTTPKLNFGSGTSTQPPSQHSLGFSVTATTAQATVNPFGISTNNIASQPNPVFGIASTTTQSSIAFGSVTATNTVSQIGSSANLTQSSVFSSSSKPIFSSSTTVFGNPNSTNAANIGNHSTTAPPPFGSQTTSTFGNQNSTNAANIGNHSTTAPPAFGSQTTSTFGNQNNTNAFAFGNTTNANPSQSGFGASGTFSLATSSPSTGEAKPPAFNSSPFMFGSSTATVNKELGKPFGTVAPLSFGSNLPQSNPSLANPAQAILPTFGTPSTGFGTGQQISAFSAGVSQPPAPSFTFGQQPSSGPTFQFNAAAPQPIQGGMFSIGSGGSSAPRSKTGAFRRRHKPTLSQ